MSLLKQDIKILGTSVYVIDAGDNSSEFSILCDSLRVDQPDLSEFTTAHLACLFCERAGLPVLGGLSYVVSGAAMRVVTSDYELERFLLNAAGVCREYPVVISKYVCMW